MRIFLCYAAERLLVAQQVDAALETEGHDVFFARDSVAAGTPFGRSIRNEVGASDLFILLVSPESVEPGSYCLTELGFARDRWPDPTGRVLPVVVAPTPPDSFPPYVQNLSALYPSGNLAAEVVASVERLERERRRRRRRSALFAAAALCTIGGIGAALWRWSDQGPGRPFLSVASIAEVRPAVAGLPPLVLVGGNARNPLPRVDSILELALDLDGAARAVHQSRWDPILMDGNGGQNFWEWFRVSANGDSLVTPRRWRTCIRHAHRRARTCGPWSPWEEGSLGGASLLPEAQRRRSRVVASGPKGFLVGLVSPHQLFMQAAGGDSLLSIPGEPAVISSAGGRVAVGTRAPGALIVLEPGGELSKYPIPGGRVNGSEASTAVASLALTEREAWVITGGPDGAPAVRLFDLPSRRWVTLPYAGDVFKFDPRGIRLRAGPSGDVWGVTTETTPSSLYRLTRTGVEETSGHQVPAVACAGDLVPAPKGAVQVLNCEGGLLQGRPRGNRFTAEAERDLRIFPAAKGDWRSEWLAADNDTLAVAITILSNDSGRADQVPLLSRIAWAVPGSERPRIGFERDSLTVTSLAVRNKVAMATVTSASGVHDLVTVPLGPP